MKHSLQLFDPADASQSEAAALVLLIAEARAVMGETVKACLARVAWHFELPAVRTINGEFYGRAEWEARAFAANDRVEFISRLLGGGLGGSSTVESIASVCGARRLHGGSEADRIHRLCVRQFSR